MSLKDKVRRTQSMINNRRNVSNESTFSRNKHQNINNNRFFTLGNENFNMNNQRRFLSDNNMNTGNESQYDIVPYNNRDYDIVPGNIIDVPVLESKNIIEDKTPWYKGVTDKTYGSTKKTLGSWYNSFKGFSFKDAWGKVRDFDYKSQLTWKNGMYALLGLGAIAGAVGGAWYGKKYLDRRKKMKELYSVTTDIDRKLKDLKGISNPTSNLAIEQVADISNGIGSLLLYTNSVMGVSEYILSYDVDSFVDELITLNNNYSDASITETEALDAIVRANIAFNPVHGEILNIIKDVEREVLTERIASKGNNSRVIISSLINGISGYVIYFSGGVIQADPFVILEKSSLRVANILESASLSELSEVNDAIKTIIETDESSKNTLESFANSFQDVDPLIGQIITVAIMPINDFFAIAPDNAQSLASILDTYLYSTLN